MMNRLRKARLLRDMSQLKLMQTTGIYFTTISRIERGWIKPSEKQRKKLARALRVKPDWLFPDGSENSKKTKNRHVKEEGDEKRKRGPASR